MIDRAFQTGEACTGREVAGPILGNVGADGQFYNFVVQPLVDEGGLVYGLSLAAVGAAAAWKVRVARLSGYFQLALAAFGLAEVLRRFSERSVWTGAH